jgi:hypothetical protein
MINREEKGKEDLFRLMILMLHNSHVIFYMECHIAFSQGGSIFVFLLKHQALPIWIGQSDIQKRALIIMHRSAWLYTHSALGGCKCAESHQISWRISIFSGVTPSEPHNREGTTPTQTYPTENRWHFTPSVVPFLAVTNMATLHYCWRVSAHLSIKESDFWFRPRVLS